MDTTERKRYQDTLELLWRAIGGIDALSNPDGLAGSMISPEERLNRIWGLVKDLNPGES